MRIAGRVVLLLVVFAGVGYLTMHLLVAHAVAQGTPEYSVRLAGAMGGLFAGGAAVVLVGIGLLIGRKRPPRDLPGDDDS